MTIGVGDTVPSAELLQIGAEGPESVSLQSMLDGRSVVIFGLPGAYTGTCTMAHVPSFIRTMDALRDKGVDEVICISVNDPFVMKAWGESTGAETAGITMLADAASEFTKAIGMNMTAPPVGFYDRSMRYAMHVQDGKVTVWHPEEGRGVCDISGGENMVAALG